VRLRLDDPVPPEDWAGFLPGLDVETLYRDHSPRLARFFARRVAAEDVADLVHETFRRLLGTAAGNRLRLANPEAYLHRIADNVLRDRGRSPTHRAAKFHVPLEEEYVGGPDPHHQLETRDTVARIDSAMQKLKPKTREIFMLHRLDGLSYAEIAAIKGISVKGVEKQIAKALTALRRQLDRR
jgi:RNA polymerase sigma-70 factor (ECF subfamily)